MGISRPNSAGPSRAARCSCHGERQELPGGRPVAVRVVRDDNDMECWVREIHLRACVRIGELVRELDTAQGGKRPTIAS